MEVLVIIPARGGSKRIPRKNVVSLSGKPLIAHTIEQARQSSLVRRIMVSTDDDEIAEVSKKWGAEVIVRPTELSTDTATSESALVHAVEFLAASESYHPELLVFLQCTSPLRKKDDIDNAIQTLLAQGADSLFSACRFNKYVWRKAEDGLQSVNFDYRKERWREQDFPVQYEENGSIYVVRPGILKKNNSRFGGKVAVYEMDLLHSLQLDTPDDMAIIECVLTLHGRELL